MAKKSTTIEPSARTPLDQKARGRYGAGGDAGVTLSERAPLAKIVLRGRLDETGFAPAVRGAVGAALPRDAHSVQTSGDRHLLWIGPDEWLLLAPDADRESLVNGLEKALKDFHAAVVDVSDARTAIRLEGPSARTVLMKAVAFDVHPRAFGPGSCRQTLVAKATCVVHQLDAVPTYDIIVNNSFASYLWDWLSDASLEHGLKAV